MQKLRTLHASLTRATLSGDSTERLRELAKVEALLRDHPLVATVLLLLSVLDTRLRFASAIRSVDGAECSGRGSSRAASVRGRTSPLHGGGGPRDHRCRSRTGASAPDR